MLPGDLFQKLSNCRYAPLTALANKRFRSLIVADKEVWGSHGNQWRHFARTNQTHNLHKRKFIFKALNYKIRDKTGLVFIQSQSSTIGQLGSSFPLSEWKSYSSRTFGRAKFPALVTQKKELPLQRHLQTIRLSSLLG